MVYFDPEAVRPEDGESSVYDRTVRHATADGDLAAPETDVPRLRRTCGVCGNSGESKG